MGRSTSLPDQALPEAQAGMDGCGPAARGQSVLEPVGGMTRFAFLSDVHGNLEALERVREDIAALAIDRVVCLGDVVSYNADQRACMELVIDEGIEWIAGNHDLIAGGLLSPVRCGAGARYSVLKARRELDPLGRQHLRGLPLLLRDDAFVAFHGSLR